jgi:hypothetical protein
VRGTPVVGLVGILLAGVMSAPTASAADPGSGPRWQNIRTSLFFTSGDVETLLATPEQRRATLAYFAPLRLSKVYLEGARREKNGEPSLREIVRALKAEGLQVSAAVVPAGERGPFCYNDPKDMETLEGRVRTLAAVLDEIIVDDWLFTTCTCAKCLAGRGSDSWADYRSRLVAEQAKHHLIDVAKQANPKARVIIKYPNWYEGHRQHGYDVAVETPEFDAVSVGIETRQRATHDQHIPIYSGYVFQKWIGGNAGQKWESAWLDNYRMQGAENDYVAQVWQAVLAQAPEILFWCAGQLDSKNPASDVYPQLVERMPEFDRLAGMLQGSARGIPIHLPLGSVGEYNVFGYLGMIGLPMAPVTSFPTDATTPVFTRHSLSEPDLARKLFERIQAGKEIFVTWQLLRELHESELGRILSVLSQDGTVSSATFRTQEVTWDFKAVEAPRPFTFPRVELTTWPYVRDVALVREDGDFGVLLRAPYLDGRMHVLILPDNTYDLLRLPEGVLNAIRRPFFKELGVRLIGPGGVALYPFGERQYVLYNMNDTAASVALRLPPSTAISGWQEKMHGKHLSTRTVDQQFKREPRGEGEVELGLTLRPFEIALVERQ